MKILFVSATFMLLLFLLLSGCVAKEAAEVPAPATNDKIKTGVEALPAWQEEWEQLVREAKKERQVALYGTFTAPLRIALTEAFKKKYGIDLDVTTGRGAENVQKVLRENTAGLNLADVIISGGKTTLDSLKSSGVLTTLEPLLLLPEVKDPQAWWQQRLPFLEDTTALAFVAYVQTPIVVNTDLVKTGELSSMRDLLNPRWKGKITMNDPAVGGTGLSWFAVFSELLGYDFMRALAKMEPVFTANQRLQVESIARGKYPVGLAAQEAEVEEFTKSGAPLGTIIPQEGSYLTYGAGVVSFFAKAPHRYAAKLFVNWLLSREGQTIYSQAQGLQSARVDVPTDHLPSAKTRQPGGKYVLEDVSLRLEKQKIAIEIFGHLLK